jgi:acyl carrier protein phosphodiesterase
MNFLAHAFLSDSKKPIQLTGNFFGDFVKGREELDAQSAEMQEGIFLHRAIDTYTDAHPVVLQSKKRLFPKYRHYGRVLVDLYYDHLLAAHFERYSATPLLPFTLQVYSLLKEQRKHVPQRAQLLLNRMAADNWLYHYRTLEGIGQACRGMAMRSSFKSGMEEGAKDLEKHYSAFEQEFFLFFEDLQQYVNTWKPEQK